jgi:superoxide reductase
MEERKNWFVAINRPADPAHPTTFEQEHTPIIEMPDEVKWGEPVSVTIRVGRQPHPYQNEHHIQFIELFQNDLYLAHVPFIPVVTRPEVTLTFVFKEGGTLRAVSRCNLHGLWETTKTLKVVP